MKLTLAQIQAAARGVAYVSEEAALVRLHRFTPEQENMYRSTNADHYLRTFATAGVILEFDTDSKFLGLSAAVSLASSRPWFVHSIFVDGKPIGQLTGDLMPSETCYAQGRWDLGEGQKRVKIYFPWTACSMIQALELDDEAIFMPVVKPKKVLIFGDSITQGYDAALPEESYASILADNLDGNCLNKAIGGEVFRPELAVLRDEGPVDLITVAYGTNDWNGRTPDLWIHNAREFYTELRKNYPDTKILVLAPVWRGDWQSDKPGGDFRQVAQTLEEIAVQIGNALFIDCFDFIPHDPAYYSPDVLHPNSDGFRCYGEKLLEVLKKENLV